MTIWCKFPSCRFRFAKDGTRACRRHQCSTGGCKEPVHVGCSYCFTHMANTLHTNVNNMMNDFVRTNCGPQFGSPFGPSFASGDSFELDL